MSNGIIGRLSTSATTYDSTGIDLGAIESIDYPKQSPLDPMSYPDTPAKDQEFYDQAGAELEVSITGEYGGNSITWAQCFAWAESIQALITGEQYDSSQPRYLALYQKDIYGPGNHLWVLRDDPTLAQNSASNGPIHVIVESFIPKIGSGSSPSLGYTLKVKQQAPY